MKIEIITISSPSLMSDPLDIVSGHVAQLLQELNVTLTCKATVADGAGILTDVLRAALRRADLVLTIGGLENLPGGPVGGAITEITGDDPTAAAPFFDGARTVESRSPRNVCLLLDIDAGSLFCLPKDRYEIRYLLETALRPYLQHRMSRTDLVGQLSLKASGIMESVIRNQLAAVRLQPGQRLSIDSFAGQTSIYLWSEGASPDQVSQGLDMLKSQVEQLLGNAIYGEGPDRLQELVPQLVANSGRRAAVAVCDAEHDLIHLLCKQDASPGLIYGSGARTRQELSQHLGISSPKEDEEPEEWCREAAAALLAASQSELALLIYNRVLEGGIQLYTTVATSHHVSVTTHSFGGHPKHIGQWLVTLGLEQLRRALLTSRL